MGKHQKFVALAFVYPCSRFVKILEVKWCVKIEKNKKGMKPFWFDVWFHPKAVLRLCKQKREQK